LFFVLGFCCFSAVIGGIGFRTQLGQFLQQQ
jgi:hypothetical protein